jgi:hypothetical protein
LKLRVWHWRALSIGLRPCELPRIPILGTWVNKGKERNAGAATSPGLVRVASCVGLVLLFGGKPKLLEHTQVIVALPLLDYLAVLEAVDGDAFKLHLNAP